MRHENAISMKANQYATRDAMFKSAMPYAQMTRAMGGMPWFLAVLRETRWPWYLSKTQINK